SVRLSGGGYRRDRRLAAGCRLMRRWPFRNNYPRAAVQGVNSSATKIAMSCVSAEPTRLPRAYIFSLSTKSAEVEWTTQAATKQAPRFSRHLLGCQANRLRDRKGFAGKLHPSVCAASRAWRAGRIGFVALLSLFDLDGDLAPDFGAAAISLGE